MEKFTKGPWYPVEYGGFWNIQDGPNYEDNNIMDTEKCEKAEDNARMASYAPEMYEFLTALVNGRFPDHEYVQEVLDKINNP